MIRLVKTDVVLMPNSAQKVAPPEAVGALASPLTWVRRHLYARQPVAVP